MLRGSNPFVHPAFSLIEENIMEKTLTVELTRVQMNVIDNGMRLVLNKTGLGAAARECYISLRNDAAEWRRTFDEKGK